MKLSRYLPVIFAVGVTASVVVVPLGLVVSVEKGRVRPKPRFERGQMVQMVAFGNAGMVVRTSCYKDDPSCYYTVRFSALQLRTDTRIFGSDGPVSISPVSLVSGIAEYELRAAP
jgi:hypothetical protein